ncbi:MAG: alkaline phosphatase [Saprospiraceae bacterium]|jgi:alkaline phosphatase
MKISFLACFIFLLVACNPTKNTTVKVPTPVTPVFTPKPQTTSKKPKNIIFMIGDGMGLTQITAGMYSNGNKIELEKFPVVGLHKSYSFDNLVTDSASGATAFASGVKTYNGAIGVNPDTVAVKTILEEAEEKNYVTGLVATSTIVHATPASFIAHVSQRKMYEEIAADFLKTDIDFFLGGGKRYFDRREKDERNLYEELRAKGYVVSDYFQEDFQDVKIDNTKKFAYLTSDDDPLPVAQGRDYLPLASKRAAEFLDNQDDKPFFLMIEGSQIDWGGHANNSDYIVTEMLDFNDAIANILEFAKADGETLVIVTADHETGGYSINPGSTMDSLVTEFTTDYHTAVMIPVFAYGPGAELFSGIYENTAIYNKMREAYGW